MKRCTKCGDEFSRAAFSNDKTRPDGKFPWCKSCKSAHARLQRATHGDRIRKQKRDEYERNKDKYIGRAKQWSANNKERRKEIALDHFKRAYAKNPLKFIARSRVGSAFVRFGYTKRSKTTHIVGCDWPTLKRHIERQFTKGMSWENRGEWHIDHIVPVSSAKSESELLALNHYTNLRPIWAKENLSKNNKAIYLI